jgi:hypothetical protein
MIVAVYIIAFGWIIYEGVRWFWRGVTITDVLITQHEGPEADEIEELRRRAWTPR